MPVLRFPSSVLGRADRPLAQHDDASSLDVQYCMYEVDVSALQTEHLASAKLAPDGEEDGETPAIRRNLDDRRDLCYRRQRAFVCLLSRRTLHLARCETNEPIVQSSPHDARQETVGTSCSRNGRCLSAACQLRTACAVMSPMGVFPKVGRR